MVFTMDNQMSNGEPVGARDTDLILFDGETETEADQTNIAKKIKTEELNKIGDQVVRNFDADVESRYEYDERRAKWLKLFAGYMAPKNYPFSNASNTHLPFILVACIQFQARAYEALFGQKEIVKCWTKNGLKEDAAKRSQNYMNYQLRYEMEDWEEGMDNSLMAIPMDGLVVRKTYPDYETGQPESKHLTVDEFIVNYRTRSLNDPRVRKTHILNTYIDLIKERQEKGIFMDYEDLILNPESYTQDHNMPKTREMQDNVTGEEEPLEEFLDKRKLLEQHVYLDINYDTQTKKLKKKDGRKRPYIVTVDYTSHKVLRIVSRETWDSEYNKIRVIEYFTAYPFIPNPNSVYAFGFGHLLDHMNEAADTALNQILDAGHLNNIIAGFINKRAGLKKGDMGFEMGLFKEVDIMAPDIKNAIYQFQFKEPSQVLFACIGMLHDYVKEVTTTAEWMSGGLPPSDTAATTMIAVIEQGLKVFSAIQKRIHRSFGKELRKIYAINHDVLDEKVYGLVQDQTSEEYKTIESGKNDFSSNNMIMPVSDPNITSRAEKLIKSQQVLMEAKNNSLMQSPESLYIATRDYLECLEAPNIDSLLPKPQPPQPIDVPPEDENAGFLQDKDSYVLPQQDHKNHLAVHEGFGQSSQFAYMTPQGKNLHSAHKQKHISADYLIEENMRKQMMQGVTGNV